MTNLQQGYARDPVAFIDTFITKNEKGVPWRLSRHQRRVLQAGIRWDGQGRLRLRTFLWGEMKKSGKTFLAACVVLWWSFVTPYTEVIIVANDLEQSVGRVFATVVDLLQHNPELGASATVRATDIALTNRTAITAIASEYKGAAGSRHSLVVFDELWGFSLERAQRLFEELTPPPTEPDAWVFIVTYAGWAGESVVLERLYQQGLSGARLDDELELYQADELVMFWSHTPRQPWQTEQYYAEQRRSMRLNAYLRLHENRWTTTESAFITEPLWDANVDPSHHPLLPDPARQDYGGIDLGIKSDRASAHLVTIINHQVVQLAHRIWKPTASEPLDIEATAEAFALDWHARSHGNVRWYVDPYQAHQMTTRLKAAGVRIEEFPQTTANTVRMDQGLFDLLNARGLRLYPDNEVRQHALNAVAVENPRGFRLAKEKASKKIDAVVALSMACVAALDQPVQAPLAFLSGGHWLGAPAPTRHLDAPLRTQPTPSALTKSMAVAHRAITAVVRAVMPSPVPARKTIVAVRRRSIETIERLDEGVRTPDEQRQLDEHYEHQRRQHRDTPLEQYLKSGGVLFPGDQIARTDSMTELMDSVRTKFARWR